MKNPLGRWQKHGLISFGLGFLVFVAAAATIDFEGANVLTLIMLAAAGVFVVAAFILIALGPRAGKKDKQAEP
jgi:hypothetical protein